MVESFEGAEDQMLENGEAGEVNVTYINEKSYIRI